MTDTQRLDWLDENMCGYIVRGGIRGKRQVEMANIEWYAGYDEHFRDLREMIDHLAALDAKEERRKALE